MKPEEAIKFLKRDCERYKMLHDCIESTECNKCYIRCSIEALEKQIPNKPKIKIHGNRVPGEREEPYCPDCDEWIGWQGYKMKHCENCGQAIDWSEEE